MDKQENQGYSCSFFPLLAHFLRQLPNYLPGQLCPAVPFCSGMEGSLKIRAASNGTEMPRKTTARTRLWGHQDG